LKQHPMHKSETKDSNHASLLERLSQTGPGLVPIALHAACSSAERIAFRQINKATGSRLRHQLIDEETRAPVDPENKGRGYEVAKGPVPDRQGRGTRSHRDSAHPPRNAASPFTPSLTFAHSSVRSAVKVCCLCDPAPCWLTKSDSKPLTRLSCEPVL